MNKNPYSPKIPCHRVIKSNGKIGGFASGTKNKINLLKKEGIIIKKGKIDFSQKSFDKEIETNKKKAINHLKELDKQLFELFESTKYFDKKIIFYPYLAASNDLTNQL